MADVLATPDLIAGYTEVVEHRDDVARAEEFYDGRVGNEFSSPRIRRLLAKSGIEGIEDVNYAHIPVDTVANRLHITSVIAVRASDDPDAEPQEVPEATAAIRRMRKRNQLDFEERGAHLDACKHGDAYLLVWPVTDDTGKVVDVDIRVNTAKNVRVIYDEEDPLRKAYTVKAWAYGERARVNLYYDNRVERWVTKVNMDPKDPKSWVHFVGDDERDAIDDSGESGWTIANPGGENPWFHLRNDRPYGRPEHINAYGAQQILNKLVDAHAASIDFQSFPQRYALTDPKLDNVQAAFGDPLAPFDEVEDPEDEDNSTSLKSDPAAVWQLVAKSVGQFEPAGPGVFMQPFDRYVQAMSETTETPLYRFGGSFAQTPSGEALRVADAPTVNKVHARQDSFGATWADAYVYALHLLGIDDVEVIVKWAPAQTVTDAEGWAVVQQKVATGVPQDVALVETGYTQEQVDGWREAEADAIGLDRRIQLLEQLSSAAQGLGAAASLGVLTPDQVQLVIVSLLGDMLPDDESPAVEHDLPPARSAQGVPGQPIPPDLGQTSQPQDAGAQQDAQYQLVG
ncbi:MAG TPA: phage portal protein [Rugosimonospora sp.]|nr:phage portal protein [Rugosimonospora sp.]